MPLPLVRQPKLLHVVLLQHLFAIWTRLVIPAVLASDVTNLSMEIAQTLMNVLLVPTDVTCPFPLVQIRLEATPVCARLVTP